MKRSYYSNTQAETNLIKSTSILLLSLSKVFFTFQGTARKRKRKKRMKPLVIPMEKKGPFPNHRVRVPMYEMRRNEYWCCVKKVNGVLLIKSSNQWRKPSQMPETMRIQHHWQEYRTWWVCIFVFLLLKCYFLKCWFIARRTFQKLLSFL